MNKSKREYNEEHKQQLMKLAKEMSEAFQTQNAGWLQLAQQQSRELSLLFESVKLPSIEQFVKLSGIYDVSRAVSVQIETLKAVQKSISLRANVNKQLLQPFTQLGSIMKLAQDTQIQQLKMFKGLLIEIPSLNKENLLGIASGFKVNLDYIAPVKGLDSEYMLKSTTIETRDLYSVQYSIESKFEMKFSTIETKVDYLIENAKRQDETIIDLVQFIKCGNSAIVRIKDIKFIKKTSEINFAGKIVKIRGNTNQSELCSVILHDKTSINKDWCIDEIVEEMGENDEYGIDWNRRIRDAAYNLNKTIKVETGLTDFFIIAKHKLCVNPKYLIKKNTKL